MIANMKAMCLRIEASEYQQFSGYGRGRDQDDDYYYGRYGRDRVREYSRGQGGGRYTGRAHRQVQEHGSERASGECCRKI